MTKRSVIHLLLSVMLTIYLGIALLCTARMEAADKYKSLEINIDHNSQAQFVSIDDIRSQLGELTKNITTLPRDSINTLEIERSIRALDNIETANCVVLSNGNVRLDVVPLIPVARVFDDNGASYYINRAGKRMLASKRFRIDVPVVSGYFGHKVQPVDLVPMLDYMSDHPEVGDLVSQICVTEGGDIMVVPMVQGHIINFGDTSDVANKFDRLKVFYRDVMPVKGWEYYDTISVKWRGQIVAKKHKLERTNHFIPVNEHLDIDDETMEAPPIEPQP